MGSSALLAEGRLASVVSGVFLLGEVETQHSLVIRVPRLASSAACRHMFQEPSRRPRPQSSFAL